jgi:hypothetical protein
LTDSWGIKRYFHGFPLFWALCSEAQAHQVSAACFLLCISGEFVAEDEAVVEDVFFVGAVFGAAAFGGIFQQNAGFEAGTVVFADPD